MSLRRSLIGAAVAALVVSTALAGCDGKGNSGGSASGPGSTDGNVDGGGSTDGEAAARPALSTNVTKGASDVKVSTPVKVKVSDGTLDDVEFKARRHKSVIDGSFNADRTALAWSRSVVRYTSKVLVPRTTRYSRAPIPETLAYSRTSQWSFPRQRG